MRVPTALLCMLIVSTLVACAPNQLPVVSGSVTAPNQGCPGDLAANPCARARR